ncbi:TniQ family protein [Poseidonibacter ostreae]|uniref:TniQ domain-containing protein n=1 Tax=Poseidonibacter ostreae TaxID=2654171 RepID=A0A6L4WV22_9BACT|nr:TniQ family protein [Poseidonibacter ostreae]KAB7890289.1 hypothetical protein GBG19_03395 [Poseidonibacter ostreae]
MISNVTHFQNLSKEKFFFTPLPLEDELLSSWLARIAYKHNTKTTSFTNMHFKNYYANNIIWLRDLDIWAPKNLLKLLSYKSGFNINIIRSMTLKSYEGKLLEKISGKTHTHFIQSIQNTSNKKQKNIGLRYCPYCLSEDKIPYFRKKWRLSFYTMCIKHHVFLQNICHKCKKIINLSKNYKDKNFAYCYNCGNDLREVKLNKILDNNKIHIIKEYLKIVQNGYTYRSNEIITSTSFFKLTKQINKMIYLWDKEKIPNPNDKTTLQIKFKYKIKKNNYEKYLDIEDQFLLYYYSYIVIQSSIYLDNYLLINKISKSQLFKDIK